MVEIKSGLAMEVEMVDSQPSKFQYFYDLINVEMNEAW